jgi:hypothetical protein
MIRSIVFVFACLLAAASHAAPFVGVAHAAHRGADFFGGGAPPVATGRIPRSSLRHAPTERRKRRMPLLRSRRAASMRMPPNPMTGRGLRRSAAAIG